MPLDSRAVDSRAPGGSLPVARIAPGEYAEQAGFMRRTEPLADLDHWWVYSEPVGEGCCGLSWPILGEGRDGLALRESLARLAALPEFIGLRVTLVVERNGERVAAELPTGGLELDRVVLRERAARVARARVRFELRDGATGQPLEGLLLDSDAEPLGPVGGSWSQRDLFLPTDFVGRVEAEGHAPAWFRVGPGGKRVQLTLGARGCIRGRLVGALPDPRDELVVRALDHDVDRWTPPLVAAIDGLGRFHAGPLRSGSYGLDYRSPRAWLLPPAPRIVVARGPIEVGDIELEVLDGLSFRLAREAGGSPSRVHVRVWRHGGERSIRSTGQEVELGESGTGTLPRVRSRTAIDLEWWTRDGWRAVTPGVLVRDHDAARPLLVRLDPPARLHVRVRARLDGPESPWRIAVTSEGEDPVGLRYLDRGSADEVAAQCAVAAIDPRGTATLEGVLAGRRALHLLSPEGCVVDSLSLDLRPGQTELVELPQGPMPGELVAANPRPSPRRLACLDAKGAMVARFSVPALGRSRVLLPAGEYRLKELGNAAHDEAATAAGDRFVVASGQSVLVTVPL
ncbi:MAG: hypothetical protein IT457_02410 [Planctomycetes bacterium]|nr:hypothetical protein [Planctomycetota bacterium]